MPWPEEEVAQSNSIEARADLGGASGVIITIFNGKINYKWAIFNSYVSLPEGI
jgi:hypothetical protein